MIEPNFIPKLSFCCGVIFLTIGLSSYTKASDLAIARSIDSSGSLSSSIESSPTRSLKIAAMTDEQAKIKLFEKTKNSVVKIITEEGTGSGFFVTKDGLVVTNIHVVKKESGEIFEKVTIEMADHTKLRGDILGVSRTQDLALIKIPNQTKLEALTLAPIRSLKVGQSVYAVGAPFGIENTFTGGILNNINIDNTQSILRHDARINSGNSGGPLINSAGQVIGVNVSLFSKDTSSGYNTSISQAIPVDKLEIFLKAYRGGLRDFISWKDSSNRKQLVQEISTDGRVISAKFQANDETDDRNIHYHRYSFKAEAGKTLTIEMTSQKVDPALVLYYLGTGEEKEKTELQQIAKNNDISSTNTNARISGTIPRAGIYVIEAKTFQPGETGEYQIKSTID